MVEFTFLWRFANEFHYFFFRQEVIFIFTSNHFSLQVHQVQIRKELILSAGAINSPKLLMLSGVGPREHLEALGVRGLENIK